MAIMMIVMRLSYFSLLIFHFSDVILMLHKMFLEGIKQRLKYWPNVRLGKFYFSDRSNFCRGFLLNSLKHISVC